MVYDPDGRVVTHAGGVHPGDRVVVRLEDGRFRADVSEVTRVSRDEESG